MSSIQLFSSHFDFVAKSDVSTCYNPGRPKKDAKVKSSNSEKQLLWFIEII